MMLLVFWRMFWMFFQAFSSSCWRSLMRLASNCLSLSSWSLSFLTSESEGTCLSINITNYFFFLPCFFICLSNFFISSSLDLSVDPWMLLCRSIVLSLVISSGFFLARLGNSVWVLGAVLGFLFMMWLTPDKSGIFSCLIEFSNGRLTRLAGSLVGVSCLCSISLSPQCMRHLSATSFLLILTSDPWSMLSTVCSPSICVSAMTSLCSLIKFWKRWSLVTLEKS
mmetsp:Transcript_2419/g.3829  ORF Transcript_2419/g.3829 Transcript_2419/m.3829 type:complete len:224 (+) Transcript_2419:97-768(+)